MSLKTRLTDLMSKMEKENPNANWKNLVTGIALLLVVLVFSTWYFTHNPSPIENDTSLPEISDYINKDQQDTNNQEQSMVNEDNSMVMEKKDYTQDEVQPGEGLWQFAKRVCGDGEKYNYIAEENNLNINTAKLVPGQKLKVNCGTK